MFEVFWGRSSSRPPNLPRLSWLVYKNLSPLTLLPLLGFQPPSFPIMGPSFFYGGSFGALRLVLKMLRLTSSSAGSTSRGGFPGRRRECASRDLSLCPSEVSTLPFIQGRGTGLPSSRVCLSRPLGRLVYRFWRLLVVRACGLALRV